MGCYVCYENDAKINQLIRIVMKTLAKNTYLYQVKTWLESGRSITSKQAIDELGCTRLSAVIFRLINDFNMPITKDMVPVKNRNGRHVEVARYYLAEVLAA
jgi:vacuolar-type H+-ATPase subunit I/STV1